MDFLLLNTIILSNAKTTSIAVLTLLIGSIFALPTSLANNAFAAACDPEVIQGKANTLGWGNAAVGNAKDGGFYSFFGDHASIYCHPNTGVFEVHGLIFDKWKSMNWEWSYLGYPLSDEWTLPDGNSRISNFEGGSMYWKYGSPEAFSVQNGPIFDKWASLNWEQGSLGFPVADFTANPLNDGFRTHFEHGTIYLEQGSNDAYVVMNGPIFDKWATLAWEQGELGYPVSDVRDGPKPGVIYQEFEDGFIYYTPEKGSYVVTPGPDGVPVITIPSSPVSVEATSQSGAAVTFSASATDDIDGTVQVTCTPASGSIFPIGTTEVKCNAMDSVGNKAQEKIFNVIVAVTDTIPPVITVPSTPVTATATSSSGAVVSFQVTGSDNTDGSLSVTCDPPSGSTFKVGETTVKCTAVDKAQNKSEKTFTVTVTAPSSSDTVPPTITVPVQTVSATASDSSGGKVDYIVTVSDNVDTSLVAVCTPASGSVFPIGNTTVTCNVKDKAGNEASEKTFAVSVTQSDKTAPTITIPSAPITATAATASGVVVSFEASATDDVDGSVAVTCTPASGTTFPVGDTTVHCTAKDKADNNAEKTFTVTVASQRVEPELKVIVIVLSVQGTRTDLNVESSSEVSNLALDENNKQITFKVSGDEGTPGVTIVPVSKVLVEPYTVKFDGSATSSYDVVPDQATGDKKIKLTYTHSTHDIAIVGAGIVVPAGGGDTPLPNMMIYGIIGAIAAAAAIGGVVAVVIWRKKKTDVNIP